MKTAVNGVTKTYMEQETVIRMNKVDFEHEENKMFANAREKMNKGENMTENKKLSEGEKYLTIQIVGHNPISAFPNKEKNKTSQPDFKANGIAVWVNKKKAETETPSEVL